MICRNCGSTVRETAKFCSSCGALHERRSGPCPHCGNPVSHGMKFCRKCGNSIANVFCPLCQRPNRLNVNFCAHCGAQMQSPAALDPFGTGRLPIGVILNRRYMITRKIAQGGMGAVYEAKEVPTSLASRKLAIKEMSFSMLDHLQADQRKFVLDSFHREFDFLSKLDHPNLVRAFEFFEEQGRQFFVMEYVEGRTLETLLANLPPGEFFPLERIMAWARQLCNALHYLHSQKPPIIYRDLKPSNIIEVAGSQLVKLFDFGIARYYKPGQLSDTVRFGTDGYLAPEIYHNQIQTSMLTDVFALGAVLHQLLTRYDPQIDPWRRPPIKNINPSVPGNVLMAIEHALSFNPETRTRDASMVLRDLFGNQNENEITNISMQNPMINLAAQNAWLKTAEPIPLEQGLPTIIEDTPHRYNKEILYLDFGKVEQGRKMGRQFRQADLSPGSETLSSDVLWLRIMPKEPAGDESLITLVAMTENLQLSNWERAVKPEWFAKIPEPFRSWLGYHTRFFIPRPQRHHGNIYLSHLGSTTARIEVQIEVQPPMWLLLFGWVIILGLMSMELFLIGGCMLFFAALF